jgi:hypothetical protein
MKTLKWTTLLLGSALCLAPVASGAVQGVNCTNDSGDSSLINTAVETLRTSGDLSNSLSLTGTCQLSLPITIQNFGNISISGPANLSGGIIACNATPAPGQYAGPMLNIIGSRSVSVRNLNISGGSGVFLQDSSGSFLGVTIDHSRSEGLSVQGASTLGLTGGTLTGPSPGTFVPAPNNVTNNCGNGINVGVGSTVSVIMLATISGNGQAGVLVNGGGASLSACCVAENVGSIVVENNRAGVTVGAIGGSAIVSGGSTCSGLTGTATVRNNSEWGAALTGASFLGLSGRVTFENNQTAPTPPAALTYRGGIYANYGATVFVSPGAIIRSTVGGPGILIDAQSKLRLGALGPAPALPSPCVAPSYPNASITLNGADGVRANHMSFVEILSTTSIVGNAGKDAQCDSTSLLDGITTGIGTNKCK